MTRGLRYTEWRYCHASRIMVRAHLWHDGNAYQSGYAFAFDDSVGMKRYVLGCAIVKPYDQLITERAARLRAQSQSIAVGDDDIHPALYPFQRAITRRALQLGSAALFEDCGMGKTIQELEWARHVTATTGKPVLVFAPLAVGPQMVKEGGLIDYPVQLVRRQSDVAGPLVVTNYEMMQHFDPSAFGGLVLDESSILKNSLGKMRNEIVGFANRIPFRLAATATPAPNDLPELLNHASAISASCRSRKRWPCSLSRTVTPPRTGD